MMNEKNNVREKKTKLKNLNKSKTLRNLAELNIIKIPLAFIKIPFKVYSDKNS